MILLVIVPGSVVLVAGSAWLAARSFNQQYEEAMRESRRTVYGEE